MSHSPPGQSETMEWYYKTHIRQAATQTEKKEETCSEQRLEDKRDRLDS